MSATPMHLAPTPEAGDRGNPLGVRRWPVRIRNIMGAESRFRHAWVPESAIYDKRLGEAFRVFCCLLAFADKNGHCFVKVKTIAALLGKARSTVSEHLSTLERLGYIVREAQFRDDGGKRENRYWVARDGLPDIPPHVGSADAGGETHCGKRAATSNPLTVVFDADRRRGVAQNFQRVHVGQSDIARRFSRHPMSAQNRHQRTEP